MASIAAVPKRQFRSLPEYNCCMAISKKGSLSFAGLFALTLLFGASSSARPLPGSCGSATVKFEVKTRKGPAPPAVPPAGKAQVVLLENENEMIGPFMHVTVRFAMDGSWIGADKGNSYFTVDVAPGKHHLCANWQSAMRRFKKNVDLTSFSAEPGKVYYFAAAVTVESQYVVNFDLSQLNEDEGEYRVKLSEHATSRQK